jgi:protoheme IX farnesyltransferase
VTLAALLLFAVVFVWTPPHFWALALLIRRDYEAAGVPMLPVVRGVTETHRQIELYATLLVAVSILPFAGGLFAVVYFAAALLLGGAFIALTAVLSRRGDNRSALRVYLYSLAYLALLFGAMVVDARL